jgi:hypothetical protein
MARINKMQKYAALWLNSQGWDLTKIANELSLTNSQVKNVVENPEVTAAAAIKTVSSPMGQSPSKNLMINESPGKRSVSIMTKEASALNDELKKKSSSPVSSKIQQGIFRPSENK